MPNIRQTISIKTGNVDPSDYIKDLLISMDPNTRGKVKIMINGYADTSIATIENGLVANASDYVIWIGHV